jgi:hypothetical protein
MKKEKEPKSSSTKTVTKKKKENCKIEFDTFEQQEDEIKTISLSDEQLNTISYDGYVAKDKEEVCLFVDSSSED